MSASVCTYDRIVALNGSPLVPLPPVVPFRFDTAFSLTPTVTSAVSDHYPVEGRFSIGSSSSTLPPSTTGTRLSTGALVAVVVIPTVACCAVIVFGFILWRKGRASETDYIQANDDRFVEVQ